MFKKIIFASVLVFNFANALEISMQKNFELTQTSSLQKTSFLLSVEKPLSSQNVIESYFAKAIQKVKDSGLCKDEGSGKYNIYPYQDYKSKQQFYKGNINFNCEFQDNKGYALLLEEISQISESLLVSQNQINYFLSDDDMLKSQDLLEDKAYEFSRQKQKELSHKLGLQCVAAKIELLQGHQDVGYRAMMLESKQQQVSSPVSNFVSAKLRVNFVFSCKN